MAYLASVHRPSSVRHAVKLRFLSEEVDSLIVAKANRLEIYEQTQDGLAMTYSRAVNGKITILQKLRAPDGGLEHLFVGTDRYMYFAVSWDAATRQLKTEKTYVDQADKTGRDAQSNERSLVDPDERFLVLELFEGILTVLPLTHRESRRKNEPELRVLGEPTPIRVEELFIRSSAFLYSSGAKAGNKNDGPQMALIFNDNQDRVYLQVKKLQYTAGKKGDAGDAEFENVWNRPRELQMSASHIIPVPGPTFGMIVVSEVSIAYYGLDAPDGPIIHELEDATIFTAWEMVDDTRWLLADDYGRLYFLMVLPDGPNAYDVSGFQLDELGTTSRASVLKYLGGGYAYVGSHSGDSQVIRIQLSGLEIIQTLPNIAPILDFTVMDMGSRSGEESTNEYSSGQARIVAGSGAFQDGTLRSVRSGVGLEDLGSLGEIGHITRLFSLRMRSHADNVLIASLIDETRAFSFASNGEVEELQDFPGFGLNEETLLAINISQDRILQCTATCVRSIDAENGMVVGDWACPANTAIVSASASETRVVLSISGAELVVLDLSNDLNLITRKTFDKSNQISCVDVPTMQPTVCLLGFWQSAEIAVLNLETLETIRSINADDGGHAVPRSILLTQILPDAPPTLFIALADGHVVTFDVDTQSWEFSSKKTTILGTQQANLQPLPRGDGLYNVFATCENPSLIHGSEDRVVYSAVTAEKASCVCPFDSEAYPGAIAIASPEDLKIAIVDRERTTHVQTLPIGETVRRIAYSTNLRAFGLGTIRRTLDDGKELVQSHFKLADEVVFKELDTFDLNENEIVESVARADLMEGPRDPVERFLVGTAYIDDADPEAVRGRILVFEVTEERKLKLVLEHVVKGACKALGVMDGKIVAALVKTVVVYSYTSAELERLAAYRTSTAPIDIAIVGDTIAIADLMKSVSVVKYQPGVHGEPDKLVEIARHYQIAWSTALAAIEENTYLEADAEGNVIVLQQNVNGVTAEDRRRLEVTSEIHLGEMVNRIRRVNVSASEDTPVVPRAFMATVDGSMYLFAFIRPDKQDFLMRLQENIASFVQSPGGIPFAKYRAFRNSVRETEGPFRFVDGDLIERFLDCDATTQGKIIEGLGQNLDETRLMVEALRRLH